MASLYRLINYNCSGQTLIELLLAIAVMSIVLPSLFVGLFAARSSKTQQRQRLQAVALLKQTQEALRNIREQGWVAFAVDGTYHVSSSSAVWGLAANSATTADGFTTQVVISDVYRDSSGAITSSGGTLDPSTKKIDTTISWGLPYLSSITATEYMTRYLDNLTYTQTTDTDFKAGVLTNTSVTKTADGEVILGAGGGGGDWCVPSKSITTYDLPKNGVANAVTAIEGAVFAGQGNNASGVAFQRVNLTTNQDPPVASNGGSLTTGSLKTNGIFADSQYAYITTDTNHSQVIILDMTQFTDPPTNSNFKQVGTIDLGTSSTNGVSVYAANNYLYVTATDGRLYIYDVTNHAAPVLKNSGGYQIGSSSSTVGNKIVVAGNYAYIATSSTTNPLRIVNISNPVSPTSAGTLVLGTGQSGVDVWVNTSSSSPSRAYLATSYLSGKNDFYIVNIENPASPTLKNDSGSTLGQYSTNGMTPNAITVVTGNRAIIVGTGGTQQYQVLNISNELSPTSCAGLSYSTGVFGVASVLQSNGYAYSYIITGDSNAELKIILGGAGGQYSSAGTFVSSPFDVATVGLNQTAFNRYSADFAQPPQTTIGFQVAVANAVNNSCTGASYTFIGPGKTSATTDLFTSSSGGIPLLTSGSYQNPGRCFKYKVYFTSSDPTKTPELYDFTVNYSP